MFTLNKCSKCWLNSSTFLCLNLLKYFVHFLFNICLSVHCLLQAIFLTIVISILIQFINQCLTNMKNRTHSVEIKFRNCKRRAGFIKRGLHYNVISAWLPNIFPVYCVWKCEQTIAVYTMQAVKIVLPVYFLTGSMGHSVYKTLVIGDHVYLKDDWATFVYSIKKTRHMENVIMMINNAGDLFKTLN